ncbi:hypothetical protein PHMEG_00026315 [Phytophthora megakarya]|uniref:Uncharacterized protein n=1 Tax=Phytophthora megakarya TaxID=4795 RepID=A0A225V8S6_9STRA|nr:hypothetical protein PHMEG_00026315 [Phytophthora megakarya]
MESRRMYQGDDRPKHITSVGGEAGLMIHAAAINGHVEVAKYLHARVDTPLSKKQKEASCGSKGKPDK